MYKVRDEYQKLGVENFYKVHSSDYTNPHFNIIKRLVAQLDIPAESLVLDLCSGGGEVTSCLSCNVIGDDPYTAKLYRENTGKLCYEFDFKQVANGALSFLKCDCIICSFALHLCPQSLINTVLYQLSLISPELIIITPNKKPDIRNFWELKEERLFERVRMRKYEVKDGIYTDRR